MSHCDIMQPPLRLLFIILLVRMITNGLYM